MRLLESLVEFKNRKFATNMRTLLGLLLLCVIAVNAQQYGLLARVFTSNMVLQRAPHRAKLWGWTTTPNERVLVQLPSYSILGESSSTYPYRWSVRHRHLPLFLVLINCHI